MMGETGGGMGRTVFIYGLMAGVLTTMLAGLGMTFLDVSDGGEAALWGFASTLLGLGIVLVGVRRYALSHPGTGFGGGFVMAFAACLFAALIYTIGWEAYAAISGHSFADDYAARTMAAKIAEGADPTALAAAQASVDTFRAQQANVAMRVLYALATLAPAALIVSVIAGLLFRTRGDGEAMD